MLHWFVRPRPQLASLSGVPHRPSSRSRLPTAAGRAELPTKVRRDNRYNEVQREYLACLRVSKWRRYTGADSEMSVAGEVEISMSATRLLGRSPASGPTLGYSRELASQKNWTLVVPSRSVHTHSLSSTHVPRHLDVPLSAMSRVYHHPVPPQKPVLQASPLCISTCPLWTTRLTSG